MNKLAEDRADGSKGVVVRHVVCVHRELQDAWTEKHGVYWHTAVQ